MKRVLIITIIGCVITVVIFRLAYGAELLLREDFESGKYSVGWSNVYEFGEITTLNPRQGGGRFSARGNHYPQDIDMRFHYELPDYDTINTLFIRYYLFYGNDPSYEWGGDANVKFMRLIGPDWGLQTEFEFMSTREYRVASYGASGAQGTTYVNRNYANGTWVKVEVLLKYDDPGMSNGTLKIWFNDELSLNKEGNYSWRGSSQNKYSAVRIPCIRGAGTTMSHDNFWQIDDIEIWKGMPEDEGSPGPPSPPPTFYIIRE